MANWGTVVQTVAEKLRRTDSRDADTIKREIVRATRWLHRTVRLPHMRDSFTMETVVATAQPLSGAVAENLGSTFKLLEITGTLFYDELKDTEDRWELMELSVDRFERISAGVVNSSIPTIWSPDGPRILTWPAPDATTSQFFGHGMFAPSPLVAKYASGTWSFYQSDGTTALADAYDDTFWLSEDQAMDLLVARAVLQCWQGPFRSAGTDVQEATAEFADVWASYDEEARRRDAVGFVMPLNLAEYI